jgi:hypothetical protein
MPNGNTPFISQKVVRAGLSALLHAAELPQGLKLLVLVDEILFDPAFPKTQHAREIAVQHLFINAITGITLMHRDACLGGGMILMSHRICVSTLRKTQNTPPN